MGRWLLNHLSTWQLGLLIVSSCMVVTVVLHRTIQQKLSSLLTEENRELAGRLVSVVMAMYGMLLAFSIVSMYQHYREANANVQFEAVQLSDMYRNSRVFDPHGANAIEQAIYAYLNTLLEEEQELMKVGQMSPQSSEDLTHLFQVVQRYEPKTKAQDVFYGQVVGSLNTLNQARRTRRDDAQTSLPAAFLILIWGGAVVLIAFLSLFSTNKSWAQTAMVTVVAGIVGVNLFLVTTLDHPFSGEISVSLRPFTEGSLGEILARNAP